MDYALVSVVAFSLLSRHRKKGKRVEVFVVSLVDINKALVVKTYIDPYIKLLKYFH